MHGFIGPDGGMVNRGIVSDLFNLWDAINGRASDEQTVGKIIRGVRLQQMVMRRLTMGVTTGQRINEIGQSE